MGFGENPTRRSDNGRLAVDQVSMQKAKRSMLYAAIRTDEPRDIAFRRIILSIPAGKVSTYGRVAAAAGYPRFHRAVARLLRTDPPDHLPWHRVLGAGGEIKLRGAAAVEQRARLKLEGVRFRGERVDMGRFEHSLKPWRFTRTFRCDQCEPNTATDLTMLNERLSRRIMHVLENATDEVLRQRLNDETTHPLTLTGTTLIQTEVGRMRNRPANVPANTKQAAIQSTDRYALTKDSVIARTAPGSDVLMAPSCKRLAWIWATSPSGKLSSASR